MLFIRYEIVPRDVDKTTGYSYWQTYISGEAAGTTPLPNPVEIKKYLIYNLTYYGQGSAKNVSSIPMIVPISIYDPMTKKFLFGKMTVVTYAG